MGFMKLSFRVAVVKLLYSRGIHVLRMLQKIRAPVRGLLMQLAFELRPPMP